MKGMDGMDVTVNGKQLRPDCKLNRRRRSTSMDIYTVATLRLSCSFCSDFTLKCSKHKCIRLHIRIQTFFFLLISFLKRKVMIKKHKIFQFMLILLQFAVAQYQLSLTILIKDPGLAQFAFELHSLYSSLENSQFIFAKTGEPENCPDYHFSFLENSAARNIKFCSQEYKIMQLGI